MFYWYILLNNVNSLQVRYNREHYTTGTRCTFICRQKNVWRVYAKGFVNEHDFLMRFLIRVHETFYSCVCVLVLANLQLLELFV